MPAERASPGARGGDVPSVKVTPVDHIHAKPSSGPKPPAKPRQQTKERVPDKARNLLGNLPKKSPQGAKRQKRDGDALRLLSPEEQAVGPTIWMDTVDQKVEAYDAWRDVGRELVRASQLQHAAMKTSRPAEYQKEPSAAAKLLLHPEVTVRFDPALFSLTVARLLPTVHKLLDPEELVPDAFEVEAFPRKAPPPEKPGTDEDCPGFAEFAERRDLTGMVEAAAAAILQQQQQQQQQQVAGKRKKGVGATPEELQEKARKAAARKARAECLAKLGDEWDAMSEAAQSEFVQIEAQMMREYEQALAAHESLAPPTATSFRVALHEPALVQRLLRLPAHGFRAVEWHGPYGPVTELACVDSASLRYDVKDSTLKLKCAISYVKAPVAAADEWGTA